LGLAFFGLTSEIAPEIRKNLFKQIHEIVFHGKGGYDWDTVYNMPIWLRKFTFHEIQQYYQAQQKAATENPSNKKTIVNSDGKVNLKEYNQFKPPAKKSNYK